jgi:2-keto-4-pentenoate hydratase/2-oxohepta-3-ene-1,7-dioic acid hydratase in catechol pathway
MKLASILTGRGDVLGFETRDGRVAELSSAMVLSGYGQGAAPTDMIALIEAGPDHWARIARAVAMARDADEDELVVHDPQAVTWRPPVRRPSKIVCLALNNSANKARILQGPDHPAYFVKPWSALIGAGDNIVCRPEYGRVHPEPELAVVIGRKAKDVPASEAMGHVFGYAIHNDLTSPTMRDEDTFRYRAIHPKPGDPAGIAYVDSWVSYPGRYKSADTFSALGPWLATANEAPDPHALKVRCSHNGRLVTEDTTANLTFKTAEVIAFVSRYMTLVPGDVISMGTALAASPSGGAVQNIDLNRLGGVVTVEIEGLGSLSNGVAWA